MDKALLAVFVTVAVLIMFGVVLIYVPIPVALGTNQTDCITAVCQIDKVLQHILEEEEKQTRLLEAQVCLAYLQSVDRARFNEREIYELCGIPPFVDGEIVLSYNGHAERNK